MPRFRNSLKPDYGRTILGLLPVPDAARRFEEVKRCAMDAPCGAVLRRTFVGEDFLLYECLNAHTHRVGAPPPKWEREIGQRHDGPWTRSDPELRVAELKEAGLCVWCTRERGPTGTSTHCGSCNLIRLRRQRGTRGGRKRNRAGSA